MYRADTTEHKHDTHFNSRSQSTLINLTHTILNYLHFYLLLLPVVAHCVFPCRHKTEEGTKNATNKNTKNLEFPLQNVPYPHSLIKNFLIVHIERLKRLI